MKYILFNMIILCASLLLTKSKIEGARNLVL